jgi:hypothetical protein
MVAVTPKETLDTTVKQKETGVYCIETFGTNGKIPSGFDIHHIDCNRENNSIENLECLPKAEHTRLYSPHNNQYTKGRKKG